MEQQKRNQKFQGYKDDRIYQNLRQMPSQV